MKQITYKRIILQSPLSIEECFVALDRDLIGINPDERSWMDPEGFTFGGFIYTDNTFFIRSLVPGNFRKGYRQVITGSITDTAVGSEIDLAFGFPFLGFWLFTVVFGLFVLVDCVFLFPKLWSWEFDSDTLKLLLFQVAILLFACLIAFSDYHSDKEKLMSLFYAKQLS